MILCAGFGQRSRPLTDELPKPLLPIGDRPLLSHITRQLRAKGRTHAVANTHWLPAAFSSVQKELEIALNLIHEAKIRGVAGAVAGARHLLEAPVIVWSGDILLENAPLDELAARAERSGQICLAVAPPRGPGTLGLDAQGRMVRVRGETHGVEVRAADYVSLFAAGRDALAALPEHGDLFADHCLPRLRRGEAIDTCPIAGRWWDIGSPPTYLQTNLDWLVSNANAGGGSYVAASASVAPGVSLQSSVVGSGARVIGSGALERCVVWPGSTAVAPLSSCVVTPRGVVSAAPLPSP
jgi:mannose-1-phosphate guanylyltransferase